METNNDKLTDLGGQLVNAAHEHANGLDVEKIIQDEAFEQFKQDNDIELAKEQAKEEYSLIDIKKLENSILKKTQGATDEQFDKLMLDITKLKNSLIEIFIEKKNDKYSYKVLDELIQINKNQINNLHLLLREQNFLIQQVKLDNSENKYLETNIDYDFINSKLKNPPMKEQNITQEIYNLLGINTEEVLCSPLRFTGVSIEKINQIFSNYGVDTNPKF